MGPLGGIKVVEIAGIGPGPFCGMVLSDLGAEVVRVDRAGEARRTREALAAGRRPEDHRPDFTLARGRRSIGVDLKEPDGLATVLRLVDRADVLFEGFRPGVMERLGLGPDVCLARNPRLVYGRMTGFGQEGPLSGAAGHDINYIALAGALDPIGRKGERPVPPLNLIGDFGGGGMLLALGILAALVERGRSGKGQVVDAAMVDGAALLSTMIYSCRAIGIWQDERGTNLLDTGAHFYDTYETKDGKHVALGAIEPQFYAELLRLTGIELEPPQMARDAWPEMRSKLAALFKTRTRDEWCTILEGSDACFAPVLSMAEAPDHPHNRERRTFVEVGGLVQPGPAPRFERTPNDLPKPPALPGEHTDATLLDWGFRREEIERLRASGAIA